MVPCKNRARSTVYQIQPLADTRWAEFVERHPRSSVFHTAPWLEALRKTYGYDPIVLTTSPPGAGLQNGLVFCRVNSWLTGKRIVSVPFADHCEPLVDHEVDMSALFCALQQKALEDKVSYIEIRPRQVLDQTTSLFRSSDAYLSHEIDLGPDLNTLFRNCHKDCIQRKIRRAIREGLTYEEGLSDSLIKTFYRLFLLTRRRHQAPPPPREWFRNLIDCFQGAAKIRVALKNGLPMASILTLRHKGTLVYKYGCSDAQFNNLGGIHLLLWHSIREAKEEGLSTFDLGRSESTNSGLVTFKDRWNAARSVLTYLRYSNSEHLPKFNGVGSKSWQTRVAKSLLPHLPDGMFTSVGNLLYKHIG